MANVQHSPPSRKDYAAVNVTITDQAAIVDDKYEEKPFSWNCCAAVKEFVTHPLTNWKSGLYFMFGILSLIALFGSMIAFLISVLICIGMSLFAIFDFRDIFYLKQKINDYHELNQQFQIANDELEQTNNKLTSLAPKFNNIVTQFTKHIESLEKDIKFVSSFIDQQNKENKNLNDDQNKAIKMFQEWIKKWKENISNKVRKMLYSAVDSIKDKGQFKLNEEQYNKFLNALPDLYKTRIQNSYPTFNDIVDQHVDQHVITSKEFSDLMNKVCNA